MTVRRTPTQPPPLSRPAVASTAQVVAANVSRPSEPVDAVAPPFAAAVDVVKRPALPGVPVLNAVQARLHARAHVVDGTAWVRAQLGRLADQVKAGTPVKVVFDLDNTVMDTRHRTLFCAQEFDRRAGTTYFAHATVDDMAGNGHDTAVALHVPPAVVDQFAMLWDELFWAPESLAHDHPIGSMVQLAQQAQAIGAEVIYLTGRVEGLHDASVAQLRAAGLDVRDDDVICKPDLAARTAPFKAGVLHELGKSATLGFFVTEGRRDLAVLHDALPDLPLLRLDCSLEDGGVALPQVPVLPRAF
jgi:hypothetical protein